MELKPIDKKLLSHLYHNNRESITKIAKACKISRDQAEYRINKYLQEGIIRNFYPILNYPALGYKISAIFFLRTCNANKKITFKDDKNIISLGKCHGKYDTYVNAIFKDEAELAKWILQTNREEIAEMEIIKPNITLLFPLKWFEDSVYETYELTKEANALITNEKDFSILKSLGENNRKKITEIAKKTKMAAANCFQRIKYLQKNKILLGQRIDFDMNKLGYNYAIIKINKKLSETIIDSLKKHCKASKNINSLIIDILNSQICIQIFHKTETELRNEIKKIEKLLERDYVYEIMLIDAEETINVLPFIQQPQHL
jgi:DNA-binding Lrp family transcriptional regulator